MKITITVEEGNDDFARDDGKVDMPTIAINLAEIVRRIGHGEIKGKMRDGNGNTAFAFEVSEFEEDSLAYD